MSRENVETYKRAVDAGNRRDLEALTAEFDPDIEWHSAVAGLGTTVYRGHEGVRELFRDAGEAFASMIIHFTEIRDLGDRVLALGRLRTRGHERGAETEVSFNQLAEFKNGRVIRLRTFLDPAEALEAAGLRE